MLEDVDVELDVLNEPEVSVEVLDELEAELCCLLTCLTK